LTEVLDLLYNYVTLLNIRMSDFQMAILFPFVPLLAFIIIELLLDISSPGDDDDDQGGGKMIPQYILQ